MGSEEIKVSRELRDAMLRMNDAAYAVERLSRDMAMGADALRIAHSTDALIEQYL